MENLIQNIYNRNFNEAENILEEKINDIIAIKLHEMKKACAAKMNEQMGPTRAQKLRMDVLEEEPDDGEESSMARSELNAIAKDAKSIMSKIKGNKELEAWTQSKITKAADYLNAVSDYMDDEEKEIDEAINPVEVTGEAPKTGQRVNQVGKGDRENTTIVPKNNLKEDETLDEARVNIVKARIRGGKIQRRKKTSNVAGYRLQGGQLTRMTAAERRKRKLGAKRAKIKRKSKMSRTLMKRRRSLMKRKAMGL